MTQPRKWNLPLTYAPKIEPVKRGECTQTIRIVNHTKAHPEGNRKQAGDLVRFFAWSGRPYHSKRERVLEEYKPIIAAWNITIFPTGIKFPISSFRGCFGYSPSDFRLESHRSLLWNTLGLSYLAKLDYISPPTGEALRDVLIGKNGKIPSEGVEAQILRWDYSKGEAE